MSLLPIVWLIFNPPTEIGKGPLQAEVVYVQSTSEMGKNIVNWMRTGEARVTDENNADSVALEPGARIKVSPALDPLARQIAEYFRRMPESLAVTIVLEPELVDRLILEIGADP